MEKGRFHVSAATSERYPKQRLETPAVMWFAPDAGVTGSARQLLPGVGVPDTGQGCSHPKSVLIHMLRVWAGRPEQLDPR